MYSIDLIKEKHTEIALDVIEREGFEFSTDELHIILGDVLDNRKMINHLYELRDSNCSDRNALGYGILFWGCGFVSSGSISTTRFGDLALKYYTHIEELDYFLGVAGDIKH